MSGQRLIKVSPEILLRCMGLLTSVALDDDRMTEREGKQQDSETMVASRFRMIERPGMRGHRLQFCHHPFCHRFFLPPTVLPPYVLPPNALPPAALPPIALPPNVLPPKVLPPTAVSPPAVPPRGLLPAVRIASVLSAVSATASTTLCHGEFQNRSALLRPRLKVVLRPYKKVDVPCNPVHRGYHEVCKIA
jgi:hypothetical protein